MPDEPGQFSSSSGVAVTISGLPDPIITGFTWPPESSTLGPIITVDVDPPALASDIDHAIEGTDRVKITDWTVDSEHGQISFKVKGRSPTPCNCRDGDTVLDLTYQGEIVTSASVKVVIPHSIGSVNYPLGSTIPFTIQNVLLNSRTVPYLAGWDPPDYIMMTTWGGTICIPVVDQFKAGLDALYNGQDVYEDGFKMNVQVAGGEYSDSVGFWYPRYDPIDNPNNVTTKDDPLHWTTDNIPPFRAVNLKIDNHAITIGGHLLVKGIVNRILTLVDNLSTLRITWSQTPPDCKL